MKQILFKPRKIVFALFVLLIVNSIWAQYDKFTYCQKNAPWEDFIIDSSFMEEKANILVVTNRSYLPDQEEFLLNELSDWRIVKYFLAYCESEKWYLSKVNGLKEGLDAINNKRNLLFFIHGHGKSFPQAMSRTSQVQMQYNINTIVFDWPSENSNFHKSLVYVRKSGENFYNLLLQLSDYKSNSMEPGQHLTILAHSLGNYFLTHLVVNGNNQYLKDGFVDNIIFNAPAIASKYHGTVISQMNFQKRSYVTLNRNDRVLRAANLLTTGKMLGNVVVPPLANNVEYVHFTEIAGTEHTYFAGYQNFEFDNSGVSEFYNTIINGGKANLNNTTYYLKRENGDGYTILP